MHYYISDQVPWSLLVNYLNSESRGTQREAQIVLKSQNVQKELYCTFQQAFMLTRKSSERIEIVPQP